MGNYFLDRQYHWMEGLKVKHTLHNAVVLLQCLGSRRIRIFGGSEDPGIIFFNKNGSGSDSTKQGHIPYTSSLKMTPILWMKMHKR